jgi:hypothetical protein
MGRVALREAIMRHSIHAACSKKGTHFFWKNSRKAIRYKDWSHFQWLISKLEKVI